MERLKYISLVAELRLIAVRKALTLLDDKEDAEDVAGEVLLRLWERHEDLRENTDEVRHLADRMTRNLALDLLRRRRRHPILRIFLRQDCGDEDMGKISDVTDSLTPQHYIEDKEAGDIVQRTMNQLPYNWRRIVEMREQEDMSFAEIAQVLGTSESSCRGMMSKARQRMLQLISKMTRRWKKSTYRNCLTVTWLLKRPRRKNNFFPTTSAPIGTFLQNGGTSLSCSVVSGNIGKTGSVT